MKNKSAYKIILPLLLVAFVLTNCDVQDANVGTFEDAADKIPNFTVIPGAESVSVTVERNNDNAYFDVNLGNIGSDAEILDGDFLGWCAHWSAPIGTSGEVYEGVTLYSTLGDENWNKLNYLLNHRQNFMDNIEGATYREIQAAIWTLIEFKEFDVNTNRIFNELNENAFNRILNNVREKGSYFRYKPGMIYAVFADMSVNETDGESTQTVIVEHGETAWGGDLDGEGTRFYSIFVLDGEATQGIYAGQNREKIGYITASVTGDDVTFTTNFKPYWVLQDTDQPVKVQGVNGSAPIGLSPPEVSAGQFATYKGDELEFIVPVFDNYLIHYDVWLLSSE